MAASFVNNTIKTTAFIAVAQAFLSACEKEGIDDLNLAYKRVGEIVGVSVPATSGGTGSQPIQSASVRRALTSEEAKQAKAVAREKKAQKLGLSVSEVNLTAQETEKARTEFRDLIAKGLSLPKPKGASTGKTGKTPKAKDSGSKGEEVLPQRPPEKTKEETESSAQGSPGSSNANTAWTRVSTARSNCKRNFPLEIEKPCALHLVAYTNDFHRLVYQWETFKKDFPREAKTKSNVYRGLVDPEGPKVPLTHNFLKLITQGLREHDNQPFVTWVLQDDEGRSYFNKGRPSEVCPKLLAAELPKNVTEELLEAAVLVRRESVLPNVIGDNTV